MFLLKELCLGEDWLKAVLGYVQGDLKSGWSLKEYIVQVDGNLVCDSQWMVSLIG